MTLWASPVNGASGTVWFCVGFSYLWFTTNLVCVCVCACMRVCVFDSFFLGASMQGKLHE